MAAFDMDKVLFTGNFKGVPTQRLRGSVTQGFYAGRITSLEDTETKDNDKALRVNFGPTVGDYTGAPLSKTYRYPREDDPKDFMWQVWRALLRAVGYTDAEIDSGNVAMSGKVLLARGGNVYFHCAEAATEEDFAEYTMLAKEDYESQLQLGGTGPKQRTRSAAAAPTGIGGAAPAAGIGAPVASIGGGNSASKAPGLDALDKRLGIA